MANNKDIVISVLCGGYDLSPNQAKEIFEQTEELISDRYLSRDIQSMTPEKMVDVISHKRCVICYSESLKKLIQEYIKENPLSIIKGDAI